MNIKVDLSPHNINLLWSIGGQHRDREGQRRAVVSDEVAVVAAVDSRFGLLLSLLSAGLFEVFLGRSVFFLGCFLKWFGLIL